MTAATEARKARIDGMFADALAGFDHENPLHQAHWAALEPAFGDLGAAMIVAQDARQNPRGALKVTDAGEIASHAGWTKRNRVVVHGEKHRFEIYDVRDNKIVTLFTRDQTVPRYVQPD